MLFNICTGAGSDQVSWKENNIKQTMYILLFFLKYTNIV